MKETHTAISTLDLPSGNEVQIIRRRFEGGPGPRVMLVAGLRGDTPEGVRVLHLVTQHLRRMSAIDGTIDIFPCANPLAAHQGVRRWPFFDVDLNETFPGRIDGHPPERLAFELVRQLEGADVLLELRGARPGFRELTQARVREGFRRETELATRTNVEMIWARTPGSSTAATFCAQFEPSIVLQGGSNNLLSTGVGEDLAAGVLNLLAALDIIPETEAPVHWSALQRGRYLTDAKVMPVRVDVGGFFLPEVQVGEAVAANGVLGRVVDPTIAEQLAMVVSPTAGRVMALREHPLVYPGSLVARVVI